MLLNIPNTFVAGTKIKSSEHNANFQSVATWANSISSANRPIEVASSTASSVVQVTASGSGAPLDLISVTRGFLPPRLTTAQINAIATPEAGEVLYNSSTAKLNTYNGSSWVVANETSEAADLENLGLAASVAANELTISLRTRAGAVPSDASSVSIGFRTSPITLGTYVNVSAAAATSLVLPSGATLGLRNGQGHAYVYALNNGGVIELAVSANQFDESVLVSTTAVSGASTSNRVLYSTTGRANVAIRCIGKITCPQATAGVYASAPTKISVGVIPFEPARSRYTSISGAGFGPGATVIIFGTRDYDPTNITNPSTGETTIPTAGLYEIQGNVNGSGSTQEQEIQVSVRVNGSAATTQGTVSYLNANAFGPPGFFYALLELQAGDIITIAASSFRIDAIDTNTPARTVCTIKKVAQSF